MAVIIDGKAAAAKVRAEVADEVARLKSKGITPGLAVIIVGGRPASRVYVDNKKKTARRSGFTRKSSRCPATPRRTS